MYLACLDIRKRLADLAGREERDLTLKDGRAISGNREIALVELIGNEAIEACGHCEPGSTSQQTRQASFGSYFVELAVSAVTSETRLRRMLGCFSAGRILNAKTARSQCLGRMAWGIGMALSEELIHDPRYGNIVNNDLAEYHIPVNADVPELEVLFLEERNPWANPMQAKGLGELSICGAAAAVTNAIYDATGVLIRTYPAMLDKVLAGLSEEETG